MTETRGSLPVLPRLSRSVGNLWRAFWRDGPAHLFGAIGRLFATVFDWLTVRKHAQYGIAVTRMLLGVVGIGMLASNVAVRHSVFGNASRWTGDLSNPVSDFPKIFPFSISHALAQTPLGLNSLMAVLAVLATLLILGWRTRIVLPVYLVLWVGFIELQDMVGDQGDNAYRIVLISMLFADSAKRWSLDARRRAAAVDTGRLLPNLWRGVPVLPRELTTLSHNLALVVLTCQVSFIYVSGALFKAGGTPWQDGSAVYAPLHVTQFSTWPELSHWITSWGPATAMISIGTVVVQASFPFALLHRWSRIPVMLAIFSFHAGIGVLMGLPWFSLAMVAVDAIFIRDETWRRIADWCSRAVAGQTRATPDLIEPSRVAVEARQDMAQLVAAGVEEARAGAAQPDRERAGQPLRR
ncbi:vitamin K-dependent gamma-carboxylase-like protein [Mycolicibacterium mucogenicum 261Sha1.1M5]|nr:vitamin K-dependent gamma-carboxylase-like protein [Mycolicibacterium mucogenicum 261Sha1.1M5]